MPTEKGVRDTVEGAGNSLTFAGGSDRPLQIALARRSSPTETLSASLDTHASADGSDMAGFSDGGALTYAHDGAPTTLSFTLTSLRRDGGPAVFRFGPGRRWQRRSPQRQAGGSRSAPRAAADPRRRRQAAHAGAAQPRPRARASRAERPEGLRASPFAALQALGRSGQGDRRRRPALDAREAPCCPPGALPGRMPTAPTGSPGSCRARPGAATTVCWQTFAPSPSAPAARPRRGASARTAPRRSRSPGSDGRGTKS